MKQTLLSLGWKLCHNSFGEETLVRFSNPRIGYKPESGTLIIGYHEWKEKVWSADELVKLIEL